MRILNTHPQNMLLPLLRRGHLAADAYTGVGLGEG